MLQSKGHGKTKFKFNTVSFLSDNFPALDRQQS